MPSRPLLPLLTALAVLAAPATSAARTCSYSTGHQSPQIRDLTASVTCRQARQVISEVRRQDDWREAFLGDDDGWITVGNGDQARDWHCTYKLRGLASKYVLVDCRRPHRDVSAGFHGR